MILDCPVGAGSGSDVTGSACRCGIRSTGRIYRCDGCESKLEYIFIAVELEVTHRVQQGINDRRLCCAAKHS